MSRGYTSERRTLLCCTSLMPPADMQPTMGMCACCRHLMRFPDAAWDSIPDLPKNAISLLSEAFTHSTSKVACCNHVF
jgi:hypothetical protein